MSPSLPARPVYLNGANEGVFALFHDAPDRGEAAVLLCPPFGWEPMCPYCAQRTWADHLAAGGYPTLQIDLPGSGNSAGNPDDPARLEVWTQAVLAAAQWLRATSGAPWIVALGIGLGGLVAYRAAIEHAPIDDLVLWAVPASGRSLVRELRAYSRLPVSSVSGPGDQGSPLLPVGAVLAAGYLLSAATVEALEAIDLTELPLPSGKHRRVLLLGRGGPTVDERLRGSLERAGVEVTAANGRGYGAVEEVFERVDSWLAEGEVNRDRPGPAVLPSARRATGSTVAEAPSSHEHLMLRCAGTELRETPVWVDRPGARLFGVLAEPVHRQAQLCAVLLAGHHRHTGPNRMWVEIARRWAARGVPTLRIDLSSIGDSWTEHSEGAAGAAVDSLFAPEYVQETKAVLEMLSARGLPARFVLVGLAAGAYWSMHTALCDERIAAIIMLNPRALIWTEQVQAGYMRSLRRRPRRSSTLPKWLGGQIAPRRFAEMSRSLAALALRTSRVRPRRITGSSPVNGSRRDPLECLLDRLRDRGQRGLLVLTGREPLREELSATGVLDRLDRWPNLELLTIETSVETLMLTPLWLQRQVHQLVDEVLDRELEQVTETAILTST